MSQAEAILKYHDVLQRCTTVNFYVIDYLRAEDVIDEAQEHDLKTERNPLKQRTLLFHWLREVPSDKYESFLEVMKDTEQEHVANLLRGNNEADEHLPLSDTRYRRLVKIRHKMANVTRVDNEVIAELRSLQAISMIDAEEIRAEKVDSTKVSKLISIIMRRSNHSYYSFNDVLNKTFQTVAANFLNEGEMPVVHINNNRPDLDGTLSDAFDQLMTCKKSHDKEIKYLIGEMNSLGLNPVTAKPGQSITMFIYCRTVDNAVKFTQLFNSRHLQHLLESIFNRLLLTIEPSNTRALDSRIWLEEDDIISLEEFTGIEGWMREYPRRLKTSVEIQRCNAITQTDKVSLVKKITGWIRENLYRRKPQEQHQKRDSRPNERKPYERYMVSSMFANDVTSKESSDVKGFEVQGDTIKNLKERWIPSADHGNRIVRYRRRADENEEKDTLDQTLSDKIRRDIVVTSRKCSRLTIVLVLLVFTLLLFIVFFYLVRLLQRE